MSVKSIYLPDEIATHPTMKINELIKPVGYDLGKRIYLNISVGSDKHVNISDTYQFGSYVQIHGNDTMLRALYHMIMDRQDVLDLGIDFQNIKINISTLNKIIHNIDNIDDTYLVIANLKRELGFLQNMYKRYLNPNTIQSQR